MHVIAKSLLALAVVLSLSACASGPGWRACPPGSHLGPYGRHCLPN